MAQVYDPRDINWDYWCSLMAERFAENQLGTVPEEDWQKWADAVSGIGRFRGIPDSRGFSDWKEWAFAFNNTLRN